jgi:hypothetical protein
MKYKIKVGDAVMYIENGKFVKDTKTGQLLRVVDIKVRNGKKSVIYNDGGYDFCEDVISIPPVLEELV